MAHANQDNLSWLRGGHTIKVGGEWMHTLNDQVFRGFFKGRYIFNSVTGSCAMRRPRRQAGSVPMTVGCPGGVYVTAPAACPGGATPSGPLLFYLQGAGRTGLATDAAGASTISNEEFSVFIQDQWLLRPGLTLNYGLRWDAQFMPETVDPTTTAYSRFLSDPTFPSDGTIPDQLSMWQPRVGIAWDRKADGKSVFRSNFGIFSARQNMLTQVGSVTTNGLQQQTIYRDFDADIPRACPRGPASSRRRRWLRGHSRTSRASVSSIAITRIRESTPSTSRTSRRWRRAGRRTSTSS
jgi:outer membrane receptor protein involved in Fe transport